MALYINNFKGRAGRKERAKQLVDEFANIEAAFTRLQALNIATYLTTYVNSTALSGLITVIPDNGYLQELTLTADTALNLAPPLNESQYRVALLIHGSNFKVTNLWGAQTWKEYGLGNWYELYTGEGRYASMLLDFFWDRCALSWICVAASKNQFNALEVGTELRFYPFLDNLTNIENDDTMGFTRPSYGLSFDNREAYHYLPQNQPRFHGIRYIENWVATPSDLASVAWVADDVTVTLDSEEGPFGSDTNRLTFGSTGAKVSMFVLPSFGRAGVASDSIKLAVSWKGRVPSGAGSVRVRAAFMGKATLDPPVHDIVQVAMDGDWDMYGVILDVTKDGNSTTSLTLNRVDARTLIEVAFISPSGSAGVPVQITDVQVEILRHTDEPTISPERMDGTIGASMTLSATGTGSWVNGTKTMTLASIGQFVNFAGSLTIGKTYLVNARLQSGNAADIRMQNDVTVWAAGDPGDDLYLEDAPFTFQYDGGKLEFALVSGSSSVYLVDIYEVSGDRSWSGYENLYLVGDNGRLEYSPTLPIPLTSGSLDGVARELASENLIPYAYFRTFRIWDSFGLASTGAGGCAKPVFQSEYGIDGWPARATILQGTSRIADGFIQRLFTVPSAPGVYDFQVRVRRTLDEDGVQIVTPQHDNVTVPVSRYIDLEAELTGGASTIGGNRIRIDLQSASFTTETGEYGLQTGIAVFKLDDWFLVNLSLTNDGLHDGFRVRIYPASGNVPDANVIDITHQGWVIIDWAQFEAGVGNFGGSSPMVGATTRAIEEFTSGLADGDYYLAAGNVHIAELVSGDVVWDVPEGVYKNVIYSTALMIPDIVPRNMHEFGLVDDQTIPQSDLVIVTSTPYPIDIADFVQLSASLVFGAMRAIPNDEADVSFQLVQAPMVQILMTTGPYDDAADVSFRLIQAPMVQILLSTGPYDDAADVSFELLQAPLVTKLVSGDTPDDAMDISISLVSAECSMTPV